MNTTILEQHIGKFQIFRVIAEEGSFSRAGERLGLTQSAVSRSLAALEGALEIQLTIRHRRGVHLTREGEMLFLFSQKLQYDLRDLEKKLQTPNELSGEVQIASYETLGVFLWPRLLQNLQTQCPKISVSLTTNHPDQHWEKLDRGIVQMILDAEPPIKESYYSKLLYKDKFGIFQGKHFKSNPKVATVERAYDEKGLTTVQYLEKQGFEVQYRLDNFPSVLALVEANISLGVLPLKLAEASVKKGMIRPFLSSSKSIEFGAHSVCLTVLESHRQDKKIKAVMKAIGECFRY